MTFILEHSELIVQIIKLGFIFVIVIGFISAFFIHPSSDVAAPRRSLQLTFLQKNGGTNALTKGELDGFRSSIDKKKGRADEIIKMAKSNPLRTANQVKSWIKEKPT